MVYIPQLFRKHIRADGAQKVKRTTEQQIGLSRQNNYVNDKEMTREDTKHKIYIGLLEVAFKEAKINEHRL